MYTKVLLLLITCLAQFNGGNGDSDDYIIVATTSGIDVITIISNNTRNTSSLVIFPAVENPESLAFDSNCQVLFYSDRKGTIRKTFWNSTTQSPTVIVEEDGVGGIFLDALHNYLYWTSQRTNSILRKNSYDPQAAVETVVTLKPGDAVWSIVVDPLESKIYWTNQNDENPSIQRSSVDSKIESIITTFIKKPHGLALDPVERKLYWTDSVQNKIEMTNYDGTNRKIIVSSGVLGPTALAVSGDYIYFVEGQTNSVIRANKHNGDDKMLVFIKDSKIYDLVTVSFNQSLAAKDRAYCYKSGASPVFFYGPLLAMSAFALTFIQ